MYFTVVLFTILYLRTKCVGIHQTQLTGVIEGLENNVKSILKEKMSGSHAKVNEITNKRSRREASDSVTIISGHEKTRDNGQTTTEIITNNTISHHFVNHVDQTDIFLNITGVNIDFMGTNINITEFGSQTKQLDNTPVYEGNTTTDRDHDKASGFHHGLISKDVFSTIHSHVLKASLPLQIIAIILCFCSVVVYSMKSMKCPTSFYLISINITEMLYSISGLIVYIAGDIYGRKAMVSYYYLSIGLYLNNYVAVALRRSTFCATSLVSAERMVVVAFPLKSKHFRLIRNPTLIVILTIFFSFVFHLFSALKYNVVPYQAPVTNETLWKFAFTDLKDPIEKWSLSSKVIFVYMPLAATLLLNVGIVLAMRRHSKARRHLNINVDKSENREKQTTIVILVSTFVFVFLAFPTVTNSLIANLLTGYGPYTKEHYTFFSIMRLGEFCELLSSIMNFIFYMTLSSKFRQSFLALVPCIRRTIPKSREIFKTVTNMTSMSTIETDSPRPVATDHCG